jgi:hypothetical protein
MTKNLYLIISSEHNLAEYQACICTKPTIIGIVTTASQVESSNRLIELLKEALPNSEIKQLTGLTGETPQECATWVDTHLKPWLASTQAVEHALNMTGGTKILAYMITFAWDWDRIDYQPYIQGKTSNIESFSMQNNRATDYRAIDLSQSSVAPITHAKLYFNGVQENKKTFNPHLLPVCDLLFTIYQANDTDHHPWWFITKSCEDVWFTRKAQEKPHHIAWAELKNEFTKQPCVQAEMREWINTINQHLDEAFFKMDDTGVFIPATKHKLVKWICGEWFEQWVEHTIKQENIKGLQLQHGVKINYQTEDRREADMLISREGKNLLLLELKADFHSGKSAQEAEKQIKTLGIKLGKVLQTLVILPIIREKRLTKQQWKAFEERCQKDKINIVEISSTQILINSLKEPIKPLTHESNTQ